MARKARELSPSGLYYIELKGDSLFITEADKVEFMKTAENIFSDGGKIYGVFLSETLIRMIVKENVNGISAAMKSLSIIYARYVNKANGITGKRFAGRFKSIPLDSVADAEAAAKSLENGVSQSAKKAAPTPKKKSQKPKKIAAQAPPKAEKEQEQTPAPQPQVKKKNLPSWLL